MRVKSWSEQRHCWIPFGQTMMVWLLCTDIDQEKLISVACTRNWPPPMLRCSAIYTCDARCGNGGTMTRSALKMLSWCGAVAGLIAGGLVAPISQAQAGGVLT